MKMIKKLLSTALIGLMAISGFSQTTGQDNLGFENWTVGQFGEMPDGWYTLYGTKQTTGAAEGTNYARLTTTFTPANPLAGLPNDTVLGGSAVLGSVNLSTFMIDQGETFNQGRPLSFDGQIKYNLLGNDTAAISVVFFSNGAIMGGTTGFIGGSQTNWTPVTIPMTYDSTITSDPDSVTIIFSAQSKHLFPAVEIGTVTDGSVFEIDGFSFVYPAPATPGNITGLDTVCANQTGVTYSIAAVTGATSYNWTVPAGATITSGAGTTSITVDFGSTVGDVCVNAQNSTGTSSDTCLTVALCNTTSAPATPGNITGLDSICVNQTGVTYSIAAVTGATTYNWTVPTGATITSGAGTTSITVDFGSSVGDVCVNAQNSAGTSADNCITTVPCNTAVAPDTPGAITGLDSICANQTGVTYSIAAVAGATSYNWTVPTGATITSGAGTTTITVDFGSLVGDVCVNAQNSAGTSADNCITTVPCNVTTAPNTPGAIIGLDSICANQTGVTFSVAAVAGATTYNWTVPAGATIVSGSGTTSITVDFGSTVGDVCVSAQNSSGTSGTSCHTTVACATSTGIVSTVEGTSIELFPNPATSRVNVIMEENASFTISLHDITGKQVYTERYSGNTQIDLSEFNAGTYFYQIRDNAGALSYTGRLNIVK